MLRSGMVCGIVRLIGAWHIFSGPGRARSQRDARVPQRSADTAFTNTRCITFPIGLAAPSMEHLGVVHPASRIAALFIFRSLIATAAKWPYRAIPEMYLS